MVCYATRVGSQQGSHRRAQRLRAAWPWLLLFAAAVVLRATRFGLVFVNGQVRFPYGADELYHLRRIWFTVANFPASLEFDRYMNYPEGSPPHWPPFFDWAIAALARLLVGSGDQHAVEAVAVWVPPLLGALGVLAAAWLVRRTYGAAAGWVTGALLVPLPAHVFHSALGMVDHHVAVGLFATLLVAAAMRLAGPPRAGGRPRGALATGAMMAAALLLWPGFLLHVLVVQLTLVVQVLATAERAHAVARAKALAGTHALAALLLAPYCAGREWKQFGAFTPEVLSNFQPLWFAAGAAVLALAAWLWLGTALGADRARRIVSALALGVAGLGAAWWLVPGLATAVTGAAGWFEADPYLEVISELQPLLEGGADLANAFFSYLFWIYPLALAALGWQALRERRAEVGVLLAASAGFCAETLYQLRFADVFAAGFAWVMGPALVEGFHAARRRFAAPAPVWVGVALVTGLAALLPNAPQYRVDVEASAAVQRGERLTYQPEVRLRFVLERAARFLKTGTPPTQGYLDPDLRPEYGVLCAWGHGHQLRYYGERPMVQDNFGPWGGRDGFDAARRYFDARDEDEAFVLAERLGARYVVATVRGSGQSPPQRGSLARRLALAREDGRPVFAGSPSSALGRHRLVFLADDGDLVLRPAQARWTVGVYEIVPGARVRGRATGRFAQFELDVPLPGRAPIRYRARVPVAADGSYEVRLPYATEAGYAVRSGRRQGSLTLSEDDVREGRTVAGPSLEP